MDDEFIKPAQVSEITGMSQGALAQLRYGGKGPRFFKPTRRSVLYRRSEVVAWIEASSQTGTHSPSFA